MKIQKKLINTINFKIGRIFLSNARNLLTFEIIKFEFSRKALYPVMAKHFFIFKNRRPHRNSQILSLITSRNYTPIIIRQNHHRNLL